MFRIFDSISELSGSARNTMKLTFLIFSVTLFIVTCSAMQSSRVMAKTEGCVDEDNCGTLCEYDGHKFFPGANKTLYRDFSCLEMTCSDDFYVQFEQ